MADLMIDDSVMSALLKFNIHFHLLFFFLLLATLFLLPPLPTMPTFSRSSPSSLDVEADEVKQSSHRS